LALIIIYRFLFRMICFGVVISGLIIRSFIFTFKNSIIKKSLRWLIVH